MNGVLEYRVHVVQSKFIVQSHFKNTYTLYLFCVKQLGKDELLEYIIDPFASSPSLLVPVFWSCEPQILCPKVLFLPSPRQLSSLSL